jgi:hypothetical protein
MYVGAVVGWEMLSYRLAMDIYCRIINLVRGSRQDRVLTNQVPILPEVTSIGLHIPFFN